MPPTPEPPEPPERPERPERYETPEAPEGRERPAAAPLRDRRADEERDPRPPVVPVAAGLVLWAGAVVLLLWRCTGP